MGLARNRLREAVASEETLVFLLRAAGGDLPEVPGLRVREATLEDATRYARDVGTDSARTFASRLSERTHCFVVEAEGQLVHATWVTTAAAWTRELRRYFRPPPGDAYVYESFTRDEARGRGVYPFALTHIAAWLGESAARRLWVAVEGSNPSSLRAVTKAGFEPVAEIAYGRRLGRLTVSAPTGPAADELASCLATSPWD